MKFFLLYREKITSKIQDYISELEITKLKNPRRTAEQIAHYSSEINNTSDHIVEEIFNEKKIDLVKLLREKPRSYYSYSVLVRKTWVIKAEASKVFDDYCEQLINFQK